ncbi:hypothetical protein ACFV6E_32765 [Streptomyces sp. NPDC059785]|uniref:hypothetical protein n=1 Tax=Streptomyces sp. NPDC059785 TaxID=3346945 RepID=UPI0036633896
MNSTGASTYNCGNRVSWISVGFATPSYQEALPSCPRPVAITRSRLPFDAHPSRSKRQQPLSFRAWLGFTAAAGSSDDPRLRFLTLSLNEPYPERLFTAQRHGAAETELRAILNDALSTCYFHRDRPAHTRESVNLERIDFLEFYY